MMDNADAHKGAGSATPSASRKLDSWGRASGTHGARGEGL